VDHRGRRGRSALVLRRHGPIARSHDARDDVEHHHGVASAGDRQFVLVATRFRSAAWSSASWRRKKGQSIPVKELGARMVAEHGRIARRAEAARLEQGAARGRHEETEIRRTRCSRSSRSPGFGQGVLGGDGTGPGAGRRRVSGALSEQGTGSRPEGWPRFLRRRASSASASAHSPWNMPDRLS